MLLTPSSDIDLGNLEVKLDSQAVEPKVPTNVSKSDAGAMLLKSLERLVTVFGLVLKL